MKAKYLNDGRKVQIIGKLNNQEMIVQEIFVTKSGDEIPSGESFTTKSLHDEPVLSWKEKEVLKYEVRYNRVKNDISLAERDQRQVLDKLKGIKAVLMSSKKLADLLPEQKLDVFTSFVTGTIEYLVVDEYNITPPVKMIDKIIYWERNYGEARYDSIKLCSVMGKSDGILEYRIHQYSDGSGSSYNKVSPFTNLEDALDYIKKRAEYAIDKNRFSDKDYKACIDMGILFSEEYKEKYRSQAKEKSCKEIERQEDIIEKAKKCLNEIRKGIL